MFRSQWKYSSFSFKEYFFRSLLLLIRIHWMDRWVCAFLPYLALDNFCLQSNVQCTLPCSKWNGKRENAVKWYVFLSLDKNLHVNSFAWVKYLDSNGICPEWWWWWWCWMRGYKTPVKYVNFSSRFSKSMAIIIRERTICPSPNVLRKQFYRRQKSPNTLIPRTSNTTVFACVSASARLLLAR